MSIIATVSPDERRYKDIEKHGAIYVYLPCPSKAEILSVAAENSELAEAQATMNRIDEFGPFPRYVLDRALPNLCNSFQKRSEAIAALDSEAHALDRLASLNSIEKSEEKNYR